MVWEVQMTASGGSEDVYSSILNEAGSVGSVLEWEPEVCAKIQVKGYFSDEVNRDDTELRVRLLLLASGINLPADGMQWRHLPDQDWTQSWKKGLQPFTVGKRFLISPSWWPEVETERLVIKIDPGLAFGSGSHETTSGCLEAMEWVSEIRDLGTFLDMGCGSGILAIGASQLGTPFVTASDVDPQAIATCRENLSLNGITEVTTVLSHNVPRGPFDTIVANILASTLLELSGGLVRELAPGGHLILSGLLEEHCQEVLSSYLAQGLVLCKTVPKAPWVTLVLHHS